MDSSKGVSLEANILSSSASIVVILGWCSMNLCKPLVGFLAIAKMEVQRFKDEYMVNVIADCKFS